jgi:uncharacterized membrane protein (DUF2068 family)
MGEAHHPRDVGVRLIVVYKFGKAALQLILAAAIVALAVSGKIEAVRELATDLRHDLASRWSLMLGRLLSAAVSRKGLHLVEIWLVLDAALTAFEGWSLWHGYAWGPLLVVVATSLPLPLEVLELIHHPRISRVALLAVNLAIVIYLAVRIAQRRKAQAG